jgi:hypothetical protein
MYVIFVAVSSTRSPAVRSDMEHVLAEGGRVTLVTSDTRAWGDLDPRVDVVTLSEAEQRHWLLRTQDAVLRRVFLKRYHQVRPWLLWRVARRAVLPRLDVSSADQIIVGDTLAVPVGWHIAQLAPDAKIGFALVRERRNRPHDALRA